MSKNLFHGSAQVGNSCFILNYQSGRKPGTLCRQQKDAEVRLLPQYRQKVFSSGSILQKRNFPKKTSFCRKRGKMNRNRNFKSSVFSLMMQDKVKALNVYNVLGNSHFDNPEDVEIITTDGGISLSVRNDASFIIGTDMNFYEHQSTYNPNMPMRSLIYCTDAIDRRIKEKNENLYGHKQIKIPTPRFVVFYNGREKRPAVEKMYLSSAYMGEKKNPDLELSCTVYNLNAPENKELLEKSEVLYGYTFFVNRVNANKESGMELEQAIDEAIDACTRENILQDFFRTYKNEVRRIMALDFTFERQIELTKMEYYKDGEKDGQLRALISLTIRKLRKGKSVEQICDELEADMATISSICKAAEEFAPEYDEEKIFRKLISEEV